MKKIIPYISILIILIGISNPAIQVLAYTNGPTAGVCLEMNVPSGRQPATAAEIAAGVNLVDVPNANGVGTTKYKYDIVTAYASSYEQQCHDLTGWAWLSWTPIVCTNSANTIPIGCVPPTTSQGSNGASTAANNGPCDYSTQGDVPGDPTTADNQPCTNTTYGLLAPLPNPNGGTLSSIDVSGSGALGNYLNVILKLAIGIAAVLAMIMIVMGGIQYMTSDFISSKEEGKHRITNAIFGLLVALGAWLILYTINPNLLNTNVNIATTTIQYDFDSPQAPVNGNYSKNGKTYPQGSAWDNSVGAIPTLPSGVTTVDGECSTVGQTGCTSLKGLDPRIVNATAAGCNCSLVITGGTEFWAHQTHGPGLATVDFRATSDLNTYLTGNAAFPTDGRTVSKNGISYYAEPAGATSNTTGQHWHVY